MICCPSAYESSLTQLYSPYLAQIFGYVVTCGVKMMSFGHGWAWQPPQIASLIHVRHIKSVWAHLYAVHGHMVAALHSYTHTTWLKFGGSESLVESNCCQYILIETDSNLKLLSSSILDIYKVFEHIDMLSMDAVAALHSHTHTYWFFGGFWVTCEAKMISLPHGWGWPLPQTTSLIHTRHIQSVWAHWNAVHRHTVVVLHSHTQTSWLRFWGSGSLMWTQNEIITWWFEASILLKLLPASMYDIYKVLSELICFPLTSLVTVLTA